MIERTLFDSFVLLILICFANTVLANSWIEELDQPYQDLENQLQTNPDNVLQTLLAMGQEKVGNNKTKQAQHHLILSQAYNSLVYSSKAIAEAKLGLENVDLTTQPWLFHRLQLALSLSLDSSGKHSQGLPAIIAALNWAQSNNNTGLIIESLTTHGYLMISLQDYLEALTSLQRAYDMAKQSNIYSEAEIAGVIALVYEYRREDELSIPYFKESVKHHRNNKNWVELSIALYGLGKAHSMIGDLQLGKQELHESADISLEIKDLQGAAYAWKELAGLAIGENEYIKAEELIQKSIIYFKQADNKLMLYDTHIVLSRMFTKLKNLEQAQLNVDKSIQYIDKKLQPRQYIAYLKQLTKVDALKGENEKAYNDLWLIMRKEKTLLAKQSTLQLHQIRSKYELDNKTKANKILEQNNDLNKIKINLQEQKHKKLQLQFFMTLLVSSLFLILAFYYRKNKKHYEHIANYDNLTGLYTRSKIFELLKLNLQKSQLKQQSFCIAMIDLDHFKRINDNFGHAIGDEVLRIIGAIFKKYLNQNCFCGRFGGEEFIIGFSNTSVEEACKTLDEIRVETMNIPKLLSLDKLNTSFSSGLCCSKSQESLDAVIKNADDSLYQAKESGRNQSVIWND